MSKATFPAVEMVCHADGGTNLARKINLQCSNVQCRERATRNERKVHDIELGNPPSARGEVRLEPRRCLSRKGHLESRWNRFGTALGYSGDAMGTLWGHLKVTSETRWATLMSRKDHSGVTVGSYWGHFGVTVELLWGHF